jgi:hypothetical protein
VANTAEIPGPDGGADGVLGLSYNGIVCQNMFGFGAAPAPELDGQNLQNPYESSKLAKLNALRW